MTSLPLLRPQWPGGSEPAGVRAAMSTRGGGVSQPPFDSLNLSRSVGDDPAHVAENRRRWHDALGVPVLHTHLVHGAAVRRVGAADVGQPLQQADALWTDEAGLACAVTAADCLPVLICRADGAAVGAAHAGWRGLAAGVVANLVQAMVAGSGARPEDLLAWLGPCIGPRQFEVGVEVLQAFGVDAGVASPHFTRRDRADGAVRWLADLPALAQAQLEAAGLRHISRSGQCTVEDRSRFFSFRRDRVTGRMAAAIWRLG